MSRQVKVDSFNYEPFDKCKCFLSWNVLLIKFSSKNEVKLCQSGAGGQYFKGSFSIKYIISKFAKVKKCKNVQWFSKKRSLELVCNKIKCTASDLLVNHLTTKVGSFTGVLTKETLHSNIKGQTLYMKNFETCG